MFIRMEHTPTQVHKIASCCLLKLIGVNVQHTNYSLTDKDNKDCRERVNQIRITKTTLKKVI